MVIGFFMPLPLAMMIPFMGIQSAVMAKQFGENFQYGKRRISAMSNEEFNKLTPKMIQDNANAELKAMIPSMENSIADMRQFQEFMIKEMIKTIGDLLRSGLGFLIGVTPEQVDQSIQDIEHYIHGHGGPHGTTAPVITPEGQLAPPPVVAQPGPTIQPIPVPRRIGDPRRPDVTTPIKFNTSLFEPWIHSSQILIVNRLATRKLQREYVQRQLEGLRKQLPNVSDVRLPDGRISPKQRILTEMGRWNVIASQLAV